MEKKNLISKLLYLLGRKEKLQSLFILLLIIISAGAELIGVSIILPIINMTMGQGNSQDSIYCRIIMKLFHVQQEKEIIIILLVGTILIYILKNAYLALMYSYLYYYTMSIRRKFAMRLLDAYITRPYSFFTLRKSSDLIRSVNQDTSNLFEVIFSICVIISQAVTAMCIIIFLASTNVVMTVVVVVCLGLCAIGIVQILQKATRKMGEINQICSSALIKYLQQAFEGIKEIKVLNTEKYFSDAYDTVFKRHVNNTRKYRVTNMLPKYLIETMVITGIMGYLALNIIFNPNYIELVPQLAVFVTAAYKLLPSVNTIYTNINTINFHKASVDLIYDDIREIELFPELITQKTDEHIDFVNEIAMNHVEFAYEETGKKILDDVSMTIKKGQSVALIGPSGGGKTTTADLLLGLQAPTKGSITIDGQDISKHMNAWHEKIGYIPQSIFILDDTVRKNVAFGVPENEIDDALVWKALKDASLEEFVQNLPDQLDTQVGERGTCISGGQRQRIGIARAMYRNPEILFFDEATSALDNETEKEVMSAIEGLHGSKTMLIIAHRLSTIENCDVVYKIENGKIERKR